MQDSSSFVIETDDLSKNFGEVNALKSLNLKVEENSIFGFLGPNGAGKTTTIKLFLGLIKPTYGTATIYGNDIVHDSKKIRTKVGYLPQDPRFHEHMTAREVLNFTSHFFFKGPKEKIKNRINEVLEIVGLEKKADRSIKGFSGGERQRLGIGQAVIHYPDLLILDEPAANLDPIGRHDVLELMSNLRRDTTIFYCTHILDDVQTVSDNVAILNEGILITQGSIEELLKGTGETIYLVSIKGDTESAFSRVSSQSWVSNSTAEKKNDITKWQINVTDEDAAEKHLLRLILTDEHLSVVEFKKKEYELEEIFLRVVEGNSDV